jgi:hypothetical protein
MRGSARPWGWGRSGVELASDVLAERQAHDERRPFAGYALHLDEPAVCAGVMQVHIRVPNLPSGDYPLIIPWVTGRSIPIEAEAEVRKAAHDFMEFYGHMGVQHKGLVDDRVKILESYLAPVDFDVDAEHVKKGTWLLAARVLDDALWRDVKEGRLTGWSIGGSAIREKEAVSKLAEMLQRP